MNKEFENRKHTRTAKLVSDLDTHPAQVFNHALFDSLLQLLHQDPIQGLVSSNEDIAENVISVTDEGIMYMSGLHGGIKFTKCPHNIRTILANLHRFTSLASIYLEDTEMPLYIEKWPVSLQVVSIIGECDSEALNSLYNLRKLGLFQNNLNLTNLNIIAPNIEELAFISTQDESILSWFTNLKWLTYGIHRGDLQPLNGLKRLKHLFIEDYQYTSLEGIQGCERLTNLRIQSGTLQDISALKQHPTLVEVSFIPTREAIRSIEPLKCSKIKVLNIPNSGVIDFSPLQTMQQLETLRLDGCLIEDLSILEGLNNLHTIGLENVESLSLPNFLEPLKLLPNLRKIYISARHRRYIPNDFQVEVIIKNTMHSTLDAINNQTDYHADTLTESEIDDILSQFD